MSSKQMKPVLSGKNKPANESSKPVSHLGRPTADQAKEIRSRIIQAATLVMSQKGYAGSSMDDIATAAGVTKRTIYTRFASKEDVFLALITENATHITNSFVPPGNIKEPCEYLEEFAWHILNALLSGQNLALMKLLASESIRMPVLAEVTQQSLDQLVAFIQEPLEKLIGKNVDAAYLTWAAEIFIYLVINPSISLAICNKLPPSAEMLRLHNKRAIKLFLNGVREAADD